jgi:hypothetical protein
LLAGSMTPGQEHCRQAGRCVRPWRPMSWASRKRSTGAGNWPCGPASSNARNHRNSFLRNCQTIYEWPTPITAAFCACARHPHLHDMRATPHKDLDRLTGLFVEMESMLPCDARPGRPVSRPVRRVRGRPAARARPAPCSGRRWRYGGGAKIQPVQPASGAGHLAGRRTGQGEVSLLPADGDSHHADDSHGDAHREQADCQEGDQSGHDGSPCLAAGNRPAGLNRPDAMSEVPAPVSDTSSRPRSTDEGSAA